VDSLKKEQSLGEILRFQLKNNIRQYAMFFVLIGIWLILTIATGGVFIQGRNLTNLLLQSSFIAVLAVGMVLVIVAGHIDLSVGSIAGFIGAVAAILNVYLGWNTIFVVVVALALGIVIGLWQGYWIAYQGIPAFIVTLAGMTIFRGLLLAVGRGETIAPISESFAALGGGYLPRLFINVGERNGFHDLTAILVVLLIIAFIVMQLRTRQKRVEYGFSVLPINVEILKIVGGSLLIGVFFIPLMTYRGIPVFNPDSHVPGAVLHLPDQQHRFRPPRLRPRRKQGSGPAVGYQYSAQDPDDLRIHGLPVGGIGFDFYRPAQVGHRQRR
jgi:D-xylose transport system permease protein